MPKPISISPSSFVQKKQAEVERRRGQFGIPNPLLLHRDRLRIERGMGFISTSLGSKAAHFVSDFTTIILNPISDEPSKSPETEAGMELREPDGEVSNIPNGPDTSSFQAFLVSLLSTTDSSSRSSEEHAAGEGKASTSRLGENKDDKASMPGSEESTSNKVSTSGPKESSSKKSLFARGKQKIGRAISKVARISGFRQTSESKVNLNVKDDSQLVGNNSDLLTVTKNDVTDFDLPEMSEPSLLLSENLRAAIYFSLPALVKGRNWVLLYSTWRHGISLSSLYRRSSLCPGYSLLVVGDHEGAVFGGLVEVPLQATNNKKYQGTNSCFVFTDLSTNPVIFQPTGSNRYFTLCSSDYLALGGGDHFALYLDGDLLTGSSSSSETFGNSRLAHTQDFKVKEVELWGFVYASQCDEMLELCRTEKKSICRP